MSLPVSNRHTRFYRAALLLYPRAFRRSYGEPMLQLFGDCVRDVGARAWLRALPDLVRTIPAQRMETVMSRLRGAGSAIALALVVLAAGAIAIGAGGRFGFVGALAIGVLALVFSQRAVFAPVFSGERAPLRHAVVQAWWAPVAALLGAAMIVFGVGTIFEAHNWGGRVFGSAFLLAFGFGMFYGLMRRPFARQSGNALILVTTIPAFPFFWVVVPTVAALVVWVGVLTSGYSDESVAPASL
ncbi:MAG: hypothetical protein JWP02_3177 [Acidimicrobiales bacterium]|nr:hypothetical protein [Acidimicrobiales bacterium]